MRSPRAREEGLNFHLIGVRPDANYFNYATESKSNRQIVMDFIGGHMTQGVPPNSYAQAMAASIAFDCEEVDSFGEFVNATSFNEINGHLQDAYLYYHLLRNDEFEFTENNLKAVLSFGSTYCSEADNSDVGSKLLVKCQEGVWMLETELLALFWGFVCKYSGFMIFTLYELFTETIYQHAGEASEPCAKLNALIQTVKNETPQQYREYLGYLNSPNSVEHLLLYLSGHNNPFTNSFYITWLLQSYTFNGGMSNGQPISKVLQALLKNITKINGCEKQMIEILLATSDNQALFENILSVFMTALREPRQLEQLCVKYVEVLFAFFAFIYIGFGLLWLIDRIYIMINKIKNACPNPDCQAPFLIPTYECPGCGEKHTNLVPSKYGILKRTCLCGTKLPTTFLNGRGQLKAYCPECDTALSGDTASRQYAFPVIGGPSVGKTCFINMAIDQMMSDVAPARSWEMSFISDTEEKDHALAMKSLNQGVRLMKTELNSLTAYQLMLKLPNEKIGRRIYVYDISGEMFSSSSDVQNNLAYSYANGFIFIIDPLTLNQFAMDVEDKVDLNAYGASSKDFEDILNIMLINLEKMFGLKDKDTLKRNLAVVINKVDIPTLEEKIGEIAAQQYLAENAETCKSYMDARDAVCRNFLEEYGAGNFVRTAEAKFKTVRYFTCSALGHNHEGQPYEGKNVVDPVMWLLQQADSSIKAE